MFRLALLAIAAVKAEEYTSEPMEMESSAPEQRRLFFRRPRFTRLSTTITTTRVASEIKVVAKQYKPYGQATWYVKVSGGKTEECPGDLNWHIHRLSTPNSNNASTCGATGGHTDTNFGCGGASEYAQLCTGTNRDPGTYTTRCEFGTTNQEQCEVGDLSGKMGKIDLTKTGWQKFTDKNIGDLKSYNQHSLVVHCCITEKSCSERVGCNTLNY